ncbi:MAG: hypothetical protein II867_03175 [Clostridia bacterium]|nr:hypothetical protein [Clostridia bacterium]
MQTKCMMCDLNVEKLILLEGLKLDSYAQTADNQFIEKTAEDFEDDLEFLVSLALQNEKVISVRAFETDDARVFAVLTEPIFFKTERDELKTSLLQDLSSGKTTYISFDNDVYRSIKENMSAGQKEAILNLIVSRKNKQ